MLEGQNKTMHLMYLAWCLTHSNCSIKGSCRETSKSLFYQPVGSKEVGRGQKRGLLESGHILKDTALARMTQARRSGA